MLPQAGWQNDGTSIANGDFNYDGQVDADDLAIWSSQFGANVSPATAAAHIPEPTSLLLLLIGLGVCSIEYRRRAGC